MCPVTISSFKKFDDKGFVRLKRVECTSALHERRTATRHRMKSLAQDLHVNMTMHAPMFAWESIV